MMIFKNDKLVPSPEYMLQTIKQCGNRIGGIGIEGKFGTTGILNDKIKTVYPNEVVSDARYEEVDKISNFDGLINCLKRIHVCTFIVLIVLLSACNGDDGGSTQEPQGIAITGTLAAPEGGDVNGTIIGACLNGICNPENREPGDVVQFKVTQRGSSVNYILDGLQSGQSYTVIAVTDINGNGKFNEDGDYGGVYTTDGTEISSVTAPASGIDVNLYEVGSGAVAGRWLGRGVSSSGAFTVEMTVLANGGADVTATVTVSGAVSGSSSLVGSYDGPAGYLQVAGGLSITFLSGTVFGNSMTGFLKLNNEQLQFTMSKVG